MNTDNLRKPYQTYLSVIVATSIIMAVNGIGNGTFHNAFAVGNAGNTTRGITNTTIPNPITTTANVAAARGNNINFTDLSKSNATTVVNPNSTLSNTTAYPTLSLFLAHHKASELPIPSAERMFTPDKAQIINKYQDPLILQMVHLPKQLIAGQPSTFILNVFYKNATWLWHSDLDIFIKNGKTGQTILAMPNTHGHGSMVQFAYVFPTAGTYNIGVIYGQQVNSPNFIKPHVVKEAIFPVNVQARSGNTMTAAISGSANNNIPSLAMPITTTMSNNSNAASNVSTSSTSTSTQPPVKDITMKVVSWSFTPNKIEVNKGDLVRLHFMTANDNVALYNGHGFGIDSYNINTFLVKGTNQTLQFVADKPGTFTFRCTSFCAFPDADPMNHFNMIGTLIVHNVPK
jgi:heme/copper-type cytochrome/quinol oxidase subunit 2